MCRLVSVVIFISCVSFGVLAEPESNATLCSKKPEFFKLNKDLKKCFNSTVERSLKPGANKTEGCQNAADFGKKLNTHIETVNTKCNKSFVIDTTNLIKLIEFSLKGDSFKKFYDDISCVLKMEYNISNDCVKAEMGFFNITKEIKHTSWPVKAKLQYNRGSCKSNIKVDVCVQKLLSSCAPATKEYMANLFDYTRTLGNCSQFPNTTAIPPAAAGGKSPAAAPWLNLPVIIILSIGAVVLVVAIIIIVVLKCKYK